MLAYHSNPKLKSAVLRQIRQHEQADRVIQGVYAKFTTRGTFARGCAVGCTLESLRRIEHLRTLEHGDHALYERYLGVPIALACLEDLIFEGLSRDEARTWPRRFARAIRPGADLSLVGPRFLRGLLAEPGAVQTQCARWPNIQPAVANVIALFNEWFLSGQKPSTERWRVARDAAYAADADAAARAAYAAADAYAAYAAADAASDAAAYAYAYAAADARRTEFRRQSDLLLRLLREAPMGGAE